VSQIWDDPNDAKPHSASLLLRDKLYRDEMESIINEFKPELRRKLKRFATWSGASEDGLRRYAISINNQQFLVDMLKEKGKLDCEYCGKEGMKLYKFPERTGKFTARDFGSKFDKRDGATCDHKQPTSKGGDKFDYANLAVCCSPCNTKKADISWDDWKIIMDSE
jgi:5-methylcytosine-specific restriction endonuclease McrA